MARSTNKSKTERQAPKQATRQIVSSNQSPSSSKPAAPHRQAAKPAPQRAVATVKPSKEELWLQVEKLERTNASLRKKNKDLRRAASDATERVAELEITVTRFEQRSAKEASRDAARDAASDAPKASRPSQKRQAAERAPKRNARKHDASKRDPGDAVPPGVAVEQPEPLSEADQAVLDHLNEELTFAAENTPNS